MPYRQHSWLFVTFGSVLLASTLPAAAQQSQSWQGSHVQHSTQSAPTTQEPSASSVPQPVLPHSLQPGREGHPQVKEMPAEQASPALPLQLQPASPAHQSAPTTQSAHFPTGPAYLGITGKTAPSCRYPAGVRVTHVITDSPAHKAGLKGASTLSWKHVATGLLALSPAGPLLLPFLSSSDEHGGGPGDLILAIDGKRIHDTEEFEQEMKRFRPGDVLYLSVLRGEGRLIQIPTHLEVYPSIDSTTQETKVARSPSGLW